MSVQINFWGVLVATAISMVVGFVYYSPKVLGNVWMKLAKVSPEKMRQGMAKKLPGVVLASLVTAYILAYVLFLFHYFFAGSWVEAGIVTALILWLGVAATSIYIHNGFEDRPTQLTYLSVGNRLITLLAMGLVLGLIHP